MSEDLRKVSLPVSGMTCAACARRVEKALSGTAGGLAASAGGYALKIAWTPSEDDLKGRLDFGSWTGTGGPWAISTSSTNSACT